MCCSSYGCGWVGGVGSHVNSKVPLYIYIYIVLCLSFDLFVFVCYLLFYLYYVVVYPLHQLLYTVMCKVWLTPPWWYYTMSYQQIIRMCLCVPITFTPPLALRIIPVYNEDVYLSIGWYFGTILDLSIVINPDSHNTIFVFVFVLFFFGEVFHLYWGDPRKQYATFYKGFLFYV